MEHEMKQEYERAEMEIIEIDKNDNIICNSNETEIIIDD